MYITTVSAHPSDRFVSLEDYTLLYVFCQLQVALFMLLFNFSNFVEEVSDIVEAFFSSIGFHSLVHVSPFIVLASGSVEKVCIGVFNKER